MKISPKELHEPILNPKVEAGASLGHSTLDELSFREGLRISEVN